MRFRQKYKKCYLIDMPYAFLSVIYPYYFGLECKWRCFCLSQM